jgi:hypothetical protein
LALASDLVNGGSTDPASVRRYLTRVWSGLVSIVKSSDIQRRVWPSFCCPLGAALANLTVGFEAQRDNRRVGARVSALAGPNDVLVSSTLRDLVIGSGIDFEDRGAHDLKGVPREWHLFAVSSARAT